MQVQAIFGAFLAGLVIPREGGLCITLTEKLEDMVSIIFLPLVRDHNIYRTLLAHGGAVFYAIRTEYKSRAAE